MTYISEKGYQDAHTKKWIDRQETNARRLRIDGDQKYVNDLILKQKREAAIRTGEEEEFRKQVKAIRYIHATGQNKFYKGFTRENLKKHFGPYGSHTYQYPNWTAEKYEKEALKLVQSAISDDIIGYKRLDGAIVRYRKSTNDLVIGYPPKDIATLYKPKDDPKRGYRYVLEKMKKKAIIHD